jgi:hypothetical protein
MATVSIPFTFANNTQNADATQVNSNFSTIASFINTEVIQRDASVAFTGIPTLPSTNPSVANHAVRKGYVDSFFPVTSANIQDGTIVDGDIAAGTITYAKLSLANSIVAGDFAAGAKPVVICTATPNTRPATPVNGQMIYETDTDRVLVYDGTGWIVVLAQGTYTPSAGGTMVVGTGGSAFNSASWSYAYGTLSISGRWVFGTSGTTFPNAPVTLTYPSGFTAETAIQSSAVPIGSALYAISGSNYIGNPFTNLSSNFRLLATRYDGSSAGIAYATTASITTGIPATWVAGSSINYSVQVQGTLAP